MTTKTVKAIPMAFTLFAGIATSSLTAEVASVTGKLGTSSAVVDSYSFTCSTGTMQSRIQVTDLNTIVNTTATIFATLGEDGSPTVTVSDTESTSSGSLPATNTLDGQGIYSLVVNKLAANADDFIV